MLGLLSIINILKDNCETMGGGGDGGGLLKVSLALFSSVKACLLCLLLLICHFQVVIVIFLSG